MSEREGWGSTSFVIDSDVLIDHLRGYEVAMDFIDSLLLDGAEVCFSVISECEVFIRHVQRQEGGRRRASV